MCDYVRARHHRSPLRSEVRRPGLHPPLPAVRINNNLLLWSSVSDPSRESIDSFSSTLCHRRNMGELDRRSGIGFMRLATVLQCRIPAAAIAARKLGPTVAVACDPTIDCRMREERGTLHGAWKKSYRTEPRCASSTRSAHWLFRSDLISPGQTTCRCSAVPIIFKTVRE